MRPPQSLHHSGTFHRATRSCEHRSLVLGQKVFFRDVEVNVQKDQVDPSSARSEHLARLLEVARGTQKVVSPKMPTAKLEVLILVVDDENAGHLGFSTAPIAVVARARTSPLGSGAGPPGSRRLAPGP